MINAINPKIGGVLIRGPKGSGKTTVVRALADILPDITVSTLCTFNCNPTDPSNMCEICNEHYHKGQAVPSQKREMTVVDLPLGATEDRVVGSLNVEKAIKTGVQALEPGILAEANQNILYVDEVNLLPDHIADDLLDAAATGWNVVEREGISVRHPSRFIFIGTMNPEEGELRPQLLDRFPLSMSVGKITSVKDRMEVVKRNIDFEAHPEEFNKAYQPLQEQLKNRIIQARQLLPKVEMPEKLVEVICKATIDLKVDGMRPDIVISKAAITLAAFEGRGSVTLDDVLVASELALSHRTREGGFLEPATPEEIKQVLTGKAKEVKHLEDTGPPDSGVGEKKKPKGKALFWQRGEASEKEEERLNKHAETRSRFSEAFLLFNRLFGGLIFGTVKRLRKKPKKAPTVDGIIRDGNIRTSEISGGEEVDTKKEVKAYPTAGSEKEPFESGKAFSQLSTNADFPTVGSALGSSMSSEGISFFARFKQSITWQFNPPIKTKAPSAKKISSQVGKRAEAVTSLHRGRPYGWRFPVGAPQDIHLPATIRAAARRQNEREKPLGTVLRISLQDVREKLRLYRARMTIMFVIDLSGSMLMNLEALKAAILNSHKEAYRSRDRVGIVAVRDTGAAVVQHPITNLGVVASKLAGLKVSGFTPLAAGMLKAWEVLKEERRRDRSTVPVMIVMTDGSANVPLTRNLETGEIRHFDTALIAVREYEDWAIRDVMSVSKMIKKEGIHTVVVNTNPRLFGHETYGFAVTQIIAKLTGGKHHMVGRLTTEDEMVERISTKIAEDRRLIAHEATRSFELAE
jgi:Mg-chelatase subunit ChlI/Mg-chelatase subunit ChlD